MVILGGLEIVAAGYLIHKHQQNKKDKARAEEEETALEEEGYGRRHSRSHHRHRSHSRRRHSRERRHSYDGKYNYRRESPRPVPVKSAMRPAAPQQVHSPSIVQQSVRPPPYATVPTAPQQPQQDIKYGWTDPPAPQQHPPQQDSNFPPTGWPSHWPQSQTPDPGARRPQAQYQRGESSRGRTEGRSVSASPHVRFEVPRNRERSPSLSPPPSYRE